jgi:hypothetical protein
MREWIIAAIVHVLKSGTSVEELLREHEEV